MKRKGFLRSIAGAVAMALTPVTLAKVKPTSQVLDIAPCTNMVDRETIRKLRKAFEEASVPMPKTFSEYWCYANGMGKEEDDLFKALQGTVSHAFYSSKSGVLEIHLHDSAVIKKEFMYRGNKKVYVIMDNIGPSCGKICNATLIAGSCRPHTWLHKELT